MAATLPFTEAPPTGSAVRAQEFHHWIRVSLISKAALAFAHRSFVCAFLLLLIGLASSSQPALAQTSDFTIIVLPDTQFYSSTYPDTFRAQTQWIVDNAASMNIQMVLGEGDIVDSATTLQYQNADSAVKILDQAGIPYLLAIGNRDYANNIPSDRGSAVSLFNTYFGPSRYATYPWYGDSYQPGSNENFYGTWNIQGKDFLFLMLEFFPRDSVLAWARSVILSHPNHEVIIVTHAYEYTDNTRSGACDNGGPIKYNVLADNDGERLWDTFVKQFNNVSLVLSGHFTNGDATGQAVGRRTDPSVGVSRNLVNQVLANYQAITNGGNGYLRILKFRPSLDTIEVKTYSPTLNAFMTDTKNQFTLRWHGTASTASGTTTLSGLVWDSSCNLVPGATVSAGGVSAVTGSTGRFSMQVPVPGAYTLSTSVAGLGSASRTLNAAAGLSAFIKLQLSNGNASISGTVRDGAGPVAGAVVSYNRASTLTDSNGNYSLSNVVPGTYDVTAVTSASLPITKSVNVPSGGNASADFVFGSGSTGSISGIVADAAGTPISGATVSYSGGSAVTNGNGSYTFSDVAAGDYVLTASAPGYQDATKDVSVHAGTISTIDFALASSTGTISGKVTSSTGAAIDGATVSYSGGSTTTDASGNYTLTSVPSGSQTVTASAAGYEQASQSVNVTAGATATANFTLASSAGTVAGKVTNSSGAAIAEATVSYSGGSTTTDASGNYTLTSVPTGSQTITASATGYQNASQTVSVTANATVTANFTLSTSTGTIAGKVANSSGAAIAGATVSYSGGSTTTDASGNYTLTSVPTGSQTVTASATGYQDASQTVSVTANATATANFTLSTSAGSIAGKVTNFSGAAIAGATVSYSGGSTTTDASGNYTLSSVPVGNQTLTASAAGFQSATQTVSVSAGATATANFTLSTSAGSIAGKVANSSGAAIAGATVSYSGGNTISDANGNYSFNNVAPAVYAVTAVATGYNSSTQNVTVNAGTNAVANFTLTAQTGTITGVITGNNGKALPGATVTITGGVVPTTITTSTNSSGRYSSGTIPVGSYQVTVVKGNYATQTKSGVVSAGNSTTLNFTLTK